MPSRGNVIYWVATGSCVGFGLIGLMTVGFPFLILGLALVVIGAWRPGIGGAWAALIGLGGLPTLLFSAHVVGAIRTSLNPYCAGDLNSGGISSPPEAGVVACSYVPAGYYALFAVFTAITLVGVGLGFLRHHRYRATAA